MNLTSAMAQVLVRVTEMAGMGQQALPKPPYRPFIDPLDVHGFWWAMLLPMALFISLAYKAVKVKDMRMYWKAAGKMTAEIVIGMVVLGAASYVVVEIIARFVAERGGG